ncbi:MAG: VWA domain-containing protein [Acidobacteria bacterium]|nr:VWA domain-containing protein [Acidobacteriota bacterium]MBU4495602.1 VWA domain-containing protein [Acidobacteriota bacterium]
MKKMKAKRKSAWIMVVAVGLAAILIRPVPIGGWGSTTPFYDTHQFIVRTAYTCLENRFVHLPGFLASVFPTIDQILSQEGNTLASGGTSGNGPDVEGSSLYSQHWYNPRFPSGNAPAATADFGLRLVNSKRTDLQAAAWGAHFLADVSTPVHLNGVMQEVILGIYNSATASGTNSNPVPLPQSITGFMGGVDPGRDWRTEIERFIASGNDFFDPWYWDSMFTPVNSTHSQWERANPAHQPTFSCTFSSFWDNGMASFSDPAVGFSTRVSKFTVDTALSADSHQEDWQMRTPQAALDNAIESVLTMWRGSFSALQPKMEITPGGSSGGKARYDVTATIKNCEKREGAANVRMKLTVFNGFGTKVFEQEQVVGSLGGDTELQVPQPWQVEIDSSTGEPRFVLEVIGEFDLPDLQYASLEQELKPVENSLVLLIDCSGSMQGDKIENAKATAQGEVGNMDEKSEVAVIIFSGCGNVRVIAPFTITTDANKQSLISSIGGISAGGGTPLAEAIEFAGVYLRGKSRGQNLNLIILSDGEETCSGNPSEKARGLNR